MKRCRKGYAYLGSLDRCIKVDKIVLEYNINLDDKRFPETSWWMTAYSNDDSILDSWSNEDLSKALAYKMEKYPKVKLVGQ